jgi:hypothetical protein
MSSRIRTFQSQILALLLADAQARFANGADPAADPDKISVIADLPGDIEASVAKAVNQLGVAVILWTPERGPVPDMERVSHMRKYLCRVWVRENVTLNRARDGALTAEEAAEIIDSLVTGQANGLTPAPRGSRLGTIALARPGIRPIGGLENQMNDFEITFETLA